MFMPSEVRNYLVKCTSTYLLKCPNGSRDIIKLTSTMVGHNDSC
ncbi:unnamed protein product, partial [Linum tenue]